MTLRQLVIEGLERAMSEPSPDRPVPLTPDQEERFQVDDCGIPVLRSRSTGSKEGCLERIDKIRDELGV